MEPVIVIPSYKPDQNLVTLISKIKQQKPQQKIIVVDDGSGSAYAKIFTQLKPYKIDILRHPINLGKGQALKTAFNCFLNRYADKSVGVVTADADGQHLPKDIFKISTALNKNPKCLWLGTRSFADKKIPLRSKIGNIITKFVFDLFTHTKLRDTQTGLRGIPNDFVKTMLQVKLSGYDFELDMLVRATSNKIKIKEVKISTVYIEKNVASHFNPIFDSMRIYFVFTRFMAVSLASATLDFVIFSICYVAMQNVFWSMAIARVISCTFNFKLNKHITFKSKNSVIPALIKYILLAVGLGFVAYGLVTSIIFIGVDVYLSKIIAEVILFIGSFSVQKLFIFNKIKTSNH